MAKKVAAPTKSRSRTATTATARRNQTATRASRTATDVSERVISEQKTDVTKAHGLGSPNPKLHPGATSADQETRGKRAAVPLARAGFTSDPNRAALEALPNVNPHPRAA